MSARSIASAVVRARDVIRVRAAQNRASSASQAERQVADARISNAGPMIGVRRPGDQIAIVSSARRVKRRRHCRRSLSVSFRTPGRSKA